MHLKLLRYKLTLEYVPGTKVCIADMLPREPPSPVTPSEDTPDELRIHSLVYELPIYGDKINLLKQATAANEALQMAQVLVGKEWSEYKRDTPIRTRQYWPIRDDHHFIEGLVFKGAKLVIFTGMRSEVLTKLHESHLGMEKCKARALSIMYWPDMGQDIEEPISRYFTCAKYKPTGPGSHSSLMTFLVVHGLSMDIFTFS